MRLLEGEKLATPKEIVDLVERFERNLLEYKSSTYNEAQTRQEFINPFFKVLGWDMDNEQGFSESYKEVIHEASLKVGSTTKAPDYGFRVGNTIKFLVEAKKPYVNLQENPEPAYQLRSYAWNAKLTISILTDFEEFAIYDCRYPPKKTDKADTALLRYFKYDEYLTRWDEIANVFSKKAILQGSFDRYAEANKSKKGIKEVDAAFLDEITSWRDSLAHNIAVRNLDLSIEALNSCVQSTIDRIVFLRICEDRGIEKYEQLQKIASGENVYAGLCDLFKHADDRYNSGLFHFKKEPGREYPDLLALDLKIDNKVLKDITSSLYPPSPYNFAVISPEILGQVYEQFLGKVIRLTEGHRAKIEDKPEVKKAGGIKYTPAYIVQCIVNRTLGTLLKGKTPIEVASIYVLDPACGSGSFLLVAYKYLLDWHLDWYVKNLAPVLDKGISITSITVKKLLAIPIEDQDNGESQKIKMGAGSRRIKARAEARAAAASVPIYKTPDGNWHLTITERKRILLNNIYGVDIDRQAVEVTKLSLLLRVLEGENQQALADLLKYSRERVLPDLDENIKCGNSLIGLDVLKFFPDIGQEEIKRINPFNWITEFPKVLQNGGFHVIIGNPPWGALLSKDDEQYLRDVAKYKVAQGRGIDTYALFIERALSLLSEGGQLSYIIPDTFLRKDDYLSTRELLLKNTLILELLELGPVFRTVPDTWCSVFTITKSLPSNRNKITHKKLSRFIVSAEERLNKFARGEWDSETEMPQSAWLQSPQMIFGYMASEPQQKIVHKVEGNKRLGQLTDIYAISRGEEGSKFAIEEVDDGDFFMVIPEHVERYSVADGLHITSSMLSPNKVKSLYRHPKIWIIRIQKMRWKQRIVSGIDERTNSAGMKTLQTIVSQTGNLSDLKYLQAILSSKLINYWCINYLADDMNKSYLEKAPIRIINFSDSTDREQYDAMVTMVSKMQELKKRKAETKISQDQNLLERQIEVMDEQINQLVYRLYGLTEEEIKIVEAQ